MGSSPSFYEIAEKSLTWPFVGPLHLRILLRSSERLCRNRSLRFAGQPKRLSLPGRALCVTMQ